MNNMREVFETIGIIVVVLVAAAVFVNGLFAIMYWLDAHSLY